MASDSRDSNVAYRARLDSHLLQERYAKVGALRAAGRNPFGNGFVVDTTAADLFARFAALGAEALAETPVEVQVAGRLRFARAMGKALFLKIQDRSTRPGIKPAWGDAEPTDDYLQLFVSKSVVGDDVFEEARSLDLGDTVWARGTVMRTKTGELSVQVAELRLATKSVRPLPEKFKGLADVEQRQRMRYVDLIVNHDSREVFVARAQIVRQIRAFFDDRGFLEVETPMMHVTPGGAAARPFATHHNALDMPLFMRIAPELFLKRLVVGGMERVYELNRNFRNEGLSRKHNPEFTMLEFYQSYATYEDLMELTEELICGLVEQRFGTADGAAPRCTWDGHEIDFQRPWRRVTVRDAVAEALGVAAETLSDRTVLEDAARACGVATAGRDDGAILFALFEERCEANLIAPTFVTAYPASVSPLARRSDADPELCDRFELYIGGREIANGFSELNDPEDQYGRFAQQLEAKAAGDEEAMPMDEDYVRALEYGLPPTAGEGIGIDRLVMLLTDSASIRDVILFPLMRPE
ncbi:MAG: lysine--tRNA ligase [Myxococcales bacterium]|nr:lysine--tRNA ligase [Myxococcales bacterium]MCB9520607.1 lysine--tRNA ligase [Myxococcales bacterium]MCB9531530.1 lysine--tRNA ligase [Myxococcales bacterium]